MVYAEAVVEQLLHLLVARGADVAAVDLELRVVSRVECVNLALLHRHLAQPLCCLDSLLAGMDEHHDLVPLAHHLDDLVEDDLIHVARLRKAARLALDTDEVLLERHGAERAVEEEQSLVAVDAGVS